MQAYKVLYRNADGVLESCCRRYEFPAAYRVYYPEDGTIVVPKVEGTKLFVFSSLILANEFSRTMFARYNMEIWEVEAANLEPVEYIGHPHDVGAFWEALKQPDFKKRVATLCRTVTLSVPRGTHWCDSLKLIGRKL